MIILQSIAYILVIVVAVLYFYEKVKVLQIKKAEEGTEDYYQGSYFIGFVSNGNIVIVSHEIPAEHIEAEMEYMKAEPINKGRKFVILEAFSC